MFTAIIENEGNTLVMEFPCKRYLTADHLVSIGIRKPAHEIKCMDEEEEPIKVKIVGNNEFDRRLALLISPTDTLSLVNAMCEFYQNLPYNESEFLVGGFPHEADDLEGWTAYHEFLGEISEDTVVNIRTQAFLYGEGEKVKATPEDVAYMMMREQRDPDFLSGHCDCIGESDFNVNWCPDEFFGQGFVQLYGSI